MVARHCGRNLVRDVKSCDKKLIALGGICSSHEDVAKLVVSVIGISEILAERVHEQCGTGRADVLSNEWRSS
jgi:hypothetical protein